MSHLPIWPLLANNETHITQLQQIITNTKHHNISVAAVNSPRPVVERMCKWISWVDPHLLVFIVIKWLG